MNTTLYQRLGGARGIAIFCSLKGQVIGV